MKTAYNRVQIFLHNCSTTLPLCENIREEFLKYLTTCIVNNTCFEWRNDTGRILFYNAGVIQGFQTIRDEPPVIKPMDKLIDKPLPHAPGCIDFTT